MANAALENNMGAEALERKETLNYQIRTEGFEKILLAMQHITQRIKKGEKCVATIEYDPDELFTRITTVSDRPGMESAQEKAEEAFRTRQSDGPTLKSRKQECIKMAMGLGIPLDYVLENYDYLSTIRIDGAKISDSYTKEGGMDLNGNCKTIAEYAFRSWMETNGFVNKYFILEVVGNEAVIKDRIGDTLNLVYDSAEKCVRVSE